MTEPPHASASEGVPTVELHLLGRKVKLERNLKPSQDPVVVDQPPPNEDQAKALSILYAEVCSSWRALVDVRFKLLGLVPAVSAVAFIELLARRPAGEELEPLAGLVIAVFGFLVTFALFVYDQRNSQLHDELISRGRRIEYELGIAVGQFRGRPGSWAVVKHDTATTVVYVVTLCAWVIAAVMFGTALLHSL